MPRLAPSIQHLADLLPSRQWTCSQDPRAAWKDGWSRESTGTRRAFSSCSHLDTRGPTHPAGLVGNPTSCRSGGPVPGTGACLRVLMRHLVHCHPHVFHLQGLGFAVCNNGPLPQVCAFLGSAPWLLSTGNSGKTVFLCSRICERIFDVLGFKESAAGPMDVFGLPNSPPAQYKECADTYAVSVIRWISRMRLTRLNGIYTSHY
jgi:hypothetical protein